MADAASSTPGPRPAPIRTDGSNAFARHTMEVRIPEMLRDTIDRNADYPLAVRDDLRRLRDDVLRGAPLALFPPPAPDYDLWQRRFAPYEGDTWLDTDWFFAEVFLYRLMMQAGRYWGTLRDPFAPFKEEEMASDALWDALAAVLDAGGDAEERLARGLRHTLWGNRIDLNLKEAAARGTRAADEHLLVDHVPRAAAHLLRAAPGHVHVVMDNAGTEQALDFALADLLLDDGPWGAARTVTLHVKMYPLFVSDVTVADVHRLLGRMRERGGPAAALARRLRSHLDAGRLRVVPDFFWNTHGMVWELPGRLSAALARASLCILKGDANYRRATNDAVWPPEATLAEAVRGFPAPLLALRTLKSDTLVGVDAARQARLDHEADDGWRVNGTYGVAQFAA